MTDPLDAKDSGFVASVRPVEIAEPEALSRLRERVAAQQPGEGGSGAVADDAALEDPDLLAEHAFAHIGLAALSGGIEAPARA